MIRIVCWSAMVLALGFAIGCHGSSASNSAPAAPPNAKPVDKGKGNIAPAPHPLPP
jgi:hypothetical protein